MSNTPRLNLIKPEGIEYVNIADLNTNADAIDQFAIEVEEQLSNVDDLETSVANLIVQVGDLPSLSTDEKTNLVGAINEVFTKLASHSAEKASQTELGHVKVDGETIFIDVNGVISLKNPDAIFLYDSGNELNTLTGGWVDGNTLGSGDRFKNADNLTISAGPENALWLYVTNNLINFNDFSTLHVEWEQTGNADSVLRVGSTKLDATLTAAINLTGAFDKRVSILDVSEISSDLYVKVGALNPSGSNVSTVKVYRIWGE